jgi:hypothetical protein
MKMRNYWKWLCTISTSLFLQIKIILLTWEGWCLGLRLWCLMPLSAIFQISWQSVLLVEETRVPGETLSHNVVSSTPRRERDSNSQHIGDSHWLHRTIRPRQGQFTVSTNVYLVVMMKMRNCWKWLCTISTSLFLQIKIILLTWEDRGDMIFHQCSV